ncbi:MAG TPA: ABC transporter permease [Jatrophihabitans sp.]|nr:ABC transporter permease [Jatrophihabitans sp.]
MPAVPLVLRWLRIELRRRWRSLVLLALLAALSGGVVLASVAGARRAASAVDRLSARANPATAVVFANTPEFEWSRVRKLPEVESLTTFVMRYSFFFDGISHRIGIGGRSLDTSLRGAYAPVDDAILHTIEQPVVLRGRLFDPARDDEVVVTPDFVKHTGKDVGDTLSLTLPSPAEVRAGLDGTSAALSGPHLAIHVVGVVRSPWFTDSVDSDGGAILSPGLVARHPQNTIGAAHSRTNPSWVNALVRLRGGEGALPKFRTALARAVHRADIQVWNLPERLREQQHEITFESRCLLAFGGAVLIAALFVLAQTMARYTAGGVGDLSAALRGAGLTRRDEIVLAAAAPTAVATCAAVAAGGIAIVASRWFPIGTAAYVEPHPGFSLDWMVIGPGVGVLILATIALAFGASLLAAARLRRPTNTRRSAVALAAARGGLPVPAVVGARLALEPGKGPTAQPVRPTLIGAVAGVVGIVAALTFSSGVHDAAAHPERYGQTFQLGGFFGQNGVDYFPTARVTGLVARSPDIAGVGDLREAVATGAGGGDSVSLFAMAPARKPLSIVVTSGRRPVAADEVLLAPRSLAALDARIGSRVALVGDHGERTYRVSGSGFVLQGGPNQVYADGGWVTGAGFDRLFNRFRFHFLLAAVAPGLDVRRVGNEVSADVSAAIGAPPGQRFRFDTTTPPIEVLELRQVRALPTVLGAFLAVLAVAALGHALAVAVRRRAPELAVLRALGMTPRQCRTALLVQATLIAVIGLGFGIPLGVALGRAVWRAVADYTPLQYIPPAATPILLLCAPLALLLANLLATVPGHRAARLQVAKLLRAE